MDKSNLYEEIAAIKPLNAEITDVQISETNIIIDEIGASEFINAWGIADDGTRVDIAGNSEWKSNDPSVVVAFDGRILAVAVGKAIVTVSCGGFFIEINVEVRALKEKELFKAPVLTPLRSEIVKRGKDMVDFKWVPKKDFRGWKHIHTYPKGQALTGIPYSQTDYQRNLAGFKNALNEPDFYDAYCVRGTNMPKYGNDCSGFVSFCWNIARTTTYYFREGIKDGTYPKVGNYDPNNPSEKDLLKSYELLQPGDALVTEKSHTFLAVHNDVSLKRVTCYEQTPDFCVQSIWTYEKLISRGKYMPFKQKSM